MVNYKTKVWLCLAVIGCGVSGTEVDVPPPATEEAAVAGPTTAGAEGSRRTVGTALKGFGKATAELAITAGAAVARPVVKVSSAAGRTFTGASLKAAQVVGLTKDKLKVNKDVLVATDQQGDLMNLNTDSTLQNKEVKLEQANTTSVYYYFYPTDVTSHNSEEKGIGKQSFYDFLRQVRRCMDPASTGGRNGAIVLAIDNGVWLSFKYESKTSQTQGVTTKSANFEVTADDKQWFTFNSNGSNTYQLVKEDGNPVDPENFNKFKALMLIFGYVIGTLDYKPNVKFKFGFGAQDGLITTQNYSGDNNIYYTYGKSLADKYLGLSTKTEFDRDTMDDFALSSVNRLLGFIKTPKEWLTVSGKLDAISGTFEKLPQLLPSESPK